MRHISLGLALFAFWLALSGHYTYFLLGIGAACSLLCVFVASRMGAVDLEAHPVHLLGRALTYIPWLIWEIAKSAWDVSRIIIHPRLPISPTLVRVKTSQKTALGVNIYANSITLTPGTISVEATRKEILVHAVTREGAEALAEGAMDRRVTAFEGEAGA